MVREECEQQNGMVCEGVDRVRCSSVPTKVAAHARLVECEVTRWCNVWSPYSGCVCVENSSKINKLFG